MNTSQRSVPVIHSVTVFDSPAFQIRDGDTKSGFCLPQCACMALILRKCICFKQYTQFLLPISEKNADLNYVWNDCLRRLGFLTFFPLFTVTKSINICISQVDIRHRVFIDLLSTQLTWLEMFYDIGSTTWPLSSVQKFKITSMNYVFYKFTPILLISFAWNANIFMKRVRIRNEQRNKTV